MAATYGEPSSAAALGAVPKPAVPPVGVNAEIAKTVEALSRDARAADARYQALNGELREAQGQMGTVNDDSTASRLSSAPRQ